MSQWTSVCIIGDYSKCSEQNKEILDNKVRFFKWRNSFYSDLLDPNNSAEDYAYYSKTVRDYEEKIGDLLIEGSEGPIDFQLLGPVEWICGQGHIRDAHLDVIRDNDADGAGGFDRCVLQSFTDAVRYLQSLDVEIIKAEAADGDYHVKFEGDRFVTYDIEVTDE